MIRVGLTEIVLFALPFAFYGMFLIATRAGVMDAASWPLSRLVWLTCVALVLVIGSFVYFANYTGAPVGSNYEPAHIEDGKFVPQRIR